MRRERDSSDSGTLEHELGVKKTVTSVTFRGTVLSKCPQSVPKVSLSLSPKCHSCNVSVGECEVSPKGGTRARGRGKR